MANVGNVDINAQTAYEQSFGVLADKTVYSGYRPGLKADLREEDGTLGKAYNSALKAFNVTTGPGAAHDVYGKLLIPLYLDPQLIDISRKYTPLVEVIPRVTNRGLYAEWATLSKTSAFVAGEDAAMAEKNDTYSRESVAIRYLYAVGRVTGQAIAATPSFIMQGMSPSGFNGGFGGDELAATAKQIEVLAKGRSIKELEEELIVNGDVDQSGEYDGLVQMFTDTTGNNVAMSTGAFDFGDVNHAIQLAFDDGGRPNVAICSSEVYADLEALIQSKQGYVPVAKNVFWGMETLQLQTMVGTMPVIPSMFASNTTAEKTLYFLDLSVCEMRVLQDLTYEPLAKTNDSEKFMMKIYEAFIIKNMAFCSAITGIATSYA